VNRNNMGILWNVVLCEMETERIRPELALITPHVSLKSVWLDSKLRKRQIKRYLREWRAKNVKIPTHMKRHLNQYHVLWCMKKMLLKACWMKYYIKFDAQIIENSNWTVRYDSKSIGNHKEQWNISMSLIVRINLRLQSRYCFAASYVVLHDFTADFPSYVVRITFYLVS
jgi:hypothetical protein